METNLKTSFEFSRVELLPLETLLLPKDKISMSRVFEMIKSIQNEGLLCPIEINKDGEVVDGICRALAFVMMGEDKIPVVKDVTHQPILAGKIVIKSYNILNFKLHLAA